MPANERVLYRGANFELGRGPGFYGIWPAGAPRPPSIEWWPETPEGWQGAWSRFTGLETPAAVTAVSPPSATFPPGAAFPPGTAVPGSPFRAAPAVPRARAIAAAALLAAGVACGIAGLFPGYFGSSSLAQQPALLVPHVIYLAVWTVSALLILRSGTLARAGALLGLGTSIVTFGLFFADAGTGITGGAHGVGAGLVLGLIGWFVCTAGAAMAFRFRPAEALGQRGRAARDRSARVVLATVAALGAAIAFAPSWDSYTLRTADGQVHSLTAGNAFANPGLVIFGNVAVMVLLVAVAAAAAWWRPVRLGAVLLAGATIPMVAEGISALVQAGGAVSPTQFGISQAQAAQAGLTISSGLTPVFWAYCVFVLALAVLSGWMLFARRRPAAAMAPMGPMGPVGPVGPVGPANAVPPGLPAAAGPAHTSAGPDTAEDPDTAAGPETPAGPAESVSPSRG